MTNEQAERQNRDRALQHKEDTLHDPDEREPHRAVEHTEPGPSRAKGDTEEQDIANLENPPQSDGPRERNNHGV